MIILLSGRDLDPEQYNSSGKGIPYVTGASNFNNGSLTINRWTESPITVSQFDDLLITCKGTIGEMAFNKIGDLHIARQVMALKVFINADYLKAFLEIKISELNKKAKSMIPGISRQDLLDMLLPIPPLSEQLRITKIVTSLQSHL